MNLSLFSLAARETRRRPLRSALTAVTVALAVGSLAALLAFVRGFQRGMAAELDRLGAHILVVPKGCPFDAASIALHGANWPCYLPARYLEEVRAVPLVGTAAPALMCAFPATNGTAEVFVGVTPELLQLRPGWRIRGRFPEAGDELLAGAEAARRAGWQPGQSVRVAALGAGTWRVAGVIEPTGAAEDGFTFLALASAQRLFGHERELTHLLVRLRQPDDLDQAVRDLRGCNAGMDMNVVPLTHLFRTLQGLLHSTRLWLLCVAALALLVAAAGVGNAVLLAASERTRELGMFRALGASRADVFLLLWLEALQVCFAGGIVGTGVALLCGGQLEAWLRSRLPFTPSDPLIRSEAWLWLACVAGALLLGSLGSLVPAWRASRLAPMIAFRTPKGT